MIDTHGQDWDWIDTLQESRSAAIAIIVLLLLCVAMATGALAAAAPKAGSAEECAYVADMTLTSRALAEEGVAPAQARKVLARMYVNAVAPAWIEAIVPWTYAARRPSSQLASEFLNTCMARGGHVQDLLGREV